MTDIPNKDRVAAYCEMHSKEVIFAAGMIAITSIMKRPDIYIVAGLDNPSYANEIAFQTLTQVLDQFGIKLNEIISDQKD